MDHIQDSCDIIRQYAILVEMHTVRIHSNTLALDELQIIRRHIGQIRRILLGQNRENTPRNPRNSPKPFSLPNRKSTTHTNVRTFEPSITVVPSQGEDNEVSQSSRSTVRLHEEKKKSQNYQYNSSDIMVDSPTTNTPPILPYNHPPLPPHSTAVSQSTLKPNPHPESKKSGAKPLFAVVSHPNGLGKSNTGCPEDSQCEPQSGQSGGVKRMRKNDTNTAFFPKGNGTSMQIKQITHQGSRNLQTIILPSLCLPVQCNGFRLNQSFNERHWSNYLQLH
jgi:hypothetical protein